MSGEKFAGISVDGDGFDGVVLHDGVDDILALADFPEDGVFAVKVRGGKVGDKKL